MELRQIKYFLILAQELNFSKAADKLCITQGTLSQQIKQLEICAGADLFERTSRSVVLTEAGQELLPIAQRTMDAATECSQVVMDLHKCKIGTLSIGVTHSFKHLLRNTVKQFIKEYPGIRLKLFYSTATDLLDKLRERKIDLFIAFKPTAEFSDIESIELFESNLTVIMRKGHPLSSFKHISMEELAKHPIAAPSPGLQSRKTIEQFVNLSTSNLKIAVETNDPNILLEIVSATNLLALTSSLAISYRDDIVSVPLEGINGKMIACVNRLKGSYVKRSAGIFTEMVSDVGI